MTLSKVMRWQCRISIFDIFVDGQINWHVCASYWHAKISHYPGLAPGFLFAFHEVGAIEMVMEGMRCSATTNFLVKNCSRKEKTCGTY